MDIVKDLLKTFLTSKKALALLAGALVWALAKAGVLIPEESVLEILLLIAAYIVGQGLADNGKEAVLAAAKVAKPADPRGA
jgi:uncharacterized membrane protein (DUF441 family)